ncbi:MAG: hypothetical protein WC794_01240 [Candidatus Doudnabacteria bacterium]
MKQMTCAQMGGPAECSFTLSGNTAEEMVKNGFDHVMQAHPEMGQKIQSNSPEENEKWMTGFRATFDAAPEV